MVLRLTSLQRTWEALAHKDPLWAVLTAADRRGNRWDPAEFFATGVQAVDGILAHVASLGLEMQRRRALDFGCGVGRLTQALARHFAEVWGADIAPSMIEKARSYNRHADRCRYVLNETDDLAVFADGRFDFILSLITLQHMSPRFAKGYLREFVRVLARGGVLVFQLPAEPIAAGANRSQRLRQVIRRLAPSPLVRLYRRVRHGHPIDMYGLPREEVESLLRESGVIVVDAVEDSSAGGGWTSFRYCVRKPS